MRNRTAFPNDSGLVWYSDDPGKSLADKIGQAAKRYRKKHGEQPDVCYVHPSSLSDNDNAKVKTVGNVRVSSLPTVLVHHFWIGVEDGDAYRWRTRPIESVLAVIAELGRETWRQRVDAVQGRLPL